MGSGAASLGLANEGGGRKGAWAARLGLGRAGFRRSLGGVLGAEVEEDVAGMRNEPRAL